MLGPGAVTLLCLGDSNTYGVYEETHETYPARLEGLLDARTPGGPHRVVNLGIPGLNSRQVLEGLPRALEELEPDAVLVLAGVNNTWSWQPDSAVDYREPPWYEGLRLVVLARLAAARVAGSSGAGDPNGAVERVDEVDRTTASGTDREGRAFSYEGPPPAGTPTPFPLDESLARDFRELDALALERAVPLVFLTYACSESDYGTTNGAIRAAAARTGRPLIDAEPAVMGLVPRLGAQQIFHGDAHPRPVGYEVFARHVFNELIALGLVAGEPVLPLDRDLECFRAPPGAALEVVDGQGDGRPPRLRVVGEEPVRPFMLILSEAGEGDRASWRGLETPVRDDELYRATCERESLRGVTGRDGAAEIDLAQALTPAEREALRGRPLLVAYLVAFLVEDEPRPRRVSAAVELAF